MYPEISDDKDTNYFLRISEREALAVSILLRESNLQPLNFSSERLLVIANG